MVQEKLAQSSRLKLSLTLTLAELVGTGSGELI